MTITDDRTRWFALYTLCAASLMIVLDATIVNVALPSIRADLGFTEDSLAWVINAYTLTFGGLLLLGGRLGDLYGPRRLFLFGIALFTVASLVCGLSTSQGMLVTARAVQGIGGAVASAVSLSLMLALFTEPADRAKAMGLFGFVASGGGSIGVVLGGVLTDAINWHWIFLVNLPIGVAVVFLSLRLIPATGGSAAHGRGLDVGGAITVTGALMVAVYAIVKRPIPNRNSLRGPYRSPSRPPRSSRPPNVSVYALITHASESSVKPRSARIDGNATFTIVASSTIMRLAAQSV
jgi:MFS family permease